MYNGIIKVISDGIILDKNIFEKYKISSDEYMIIYNDNQMILHAVENDDIENSLYCYECDIYKYKKSDYDFEVNMNNKLFIDVLKSYFIYEPYLIPNIPVPIKNNFFDVINYIRQKDADNITISYNNNNSNYIEIRLANGTYLNIEFSDNNQINNMKLSRESIIQAKYNDSKSNLGTIFGFYLVYYLFINDNFIK